MCQSFSHYFKSWSSAACRDLDMIREYVDKSPGVFSLIRCSSEPDLVTKSPSGVIVKCTTRVIHDRYKPYGNCEMTEEVADLNELLRDAAADTDEWIADYGLTTTPMSLRVHVPFHDPATMGHQRLHCNVTVADVIARLEDGVCQLCQGDRHLCCGCLSSDHEFANNWLGDDWEGFPRACGAHMICPVCIGPDFSYHYRDRYENVTHDALHIEGSAKERVVELGYARSVDSIPWSMDDREKVAEWHRQQKKVLTTQVMAQK